MKSLINIYIIIIIFFFFNQFFLLKLKRNIIKNSYLVINFFFINDMFFSFLIIYYYNTVMLVSFRLFLIKCYYTYCIYFYFGESNNYLFLIKNYCGLLIYYIIYSDIIRFFIYFSLLNFFNFKLFVIFWVLFESLDFFSLSINYIGNILVLGKNRFNEEIILTKKGRKKKIQYLKTLFFKNLKLDPFKFKIKFEDDFFYRESFLNELTYKKFN